MSDTSKPPDRVWITNIDLCRQAERVKCHRTPAFQAWDFGGIDDHAYIHEDSLPGTVEEIKQAIELADELHHLVSRGEGSEDQLSYLLIDLGRALAAMKKEQP